MVMELDSEEDQMATTAAPNRPRRRSQQPRVSVRARDRAAAYESEYDLLTAALIGATIGAGLTYMLRRGRRGAGPCRPSSAVSARGANWAGRQASELGRRGASGRRTGARKCGTGSRATRSSRTSRDYMGRARETIDDAVESELKDLRRAIRRQRKRLGI